MRRHKKVRKYFTGGELALAKGALDITGDLFDEVGDTLNLEEDTTEILKSSRFGALGTGYGVARKMLNDKKAKMNASFDIQQFSMGGDILKEFDLPSHAQGGGKLGKHGVIDNVNPIAEIELDETLMNGNYVFSDRLMSGDKTFAEKSKALKKKYNKDTTESKNTLQLMLDDLKLEQEAARIDTEIAGLPKMFDGGPLDTEYLFPANDMDFSLADDYNPTRGINTLSDDTPVFDPDSTEPSTRDFNLFDNIDETMKPALIGKGFEAGIQALQAFRPSEQQNLYLNPEADRVRDLSNNRIDFQQLFNDQTLAFNAGRTDIVNASRGQGQTLSNLQALSAAEGRGRAQLSLQQQEVDANLRMQEADVLNNLGQQEAQARFVRADIQSANDARRRDAVRAVGSTAGNLGAFMTNKKVSDLRATEALRLLSQINPDFGTASSIEEHRKLLAQKDAELIRFKTKTNESE